MSAALKECDASNYIGNWNKLEISRPPDKLWSAAAMSLPWWLHVHTALRLSKSYRSGTLP